MNSKRAEVINENQREFVTLSFSRRMVRVLVMTLALFVISMAFSFWLAGHDRDLVGQTWDRAYVSGWEACKLTLDPRGLRTRTDTYGWGEQPLAPAR